MNAIKLQEARTLEILLSANLVDVTDVVAWADRNILEVDQPEHVFLELAVLGQEDWLRCLDMLRWISEDRGVPDLLLGVFARAAEVESDVWRPVSSFMWRRFHAIDFDEKPPWHELSIAGLMVIEEDHGYPYYDMRKAELQSRMCLEKYLRVDTSGLGLSADALAAALKQQYFR